MVNPIGTSGLAASALAAQAAGAAQQEGSLTFADALKSALGQVEDLQTRANDAIGQFLAGEDVELHEVMAAAEEAGIALEMLVEMRNKVVEAYRTIVSMQV